MMLAPADPAFLDQLTAQLPADTLRAAAPRYLEEPRNLWHGQAGPVALPRSAEEVSIILRMAQAARVGIIPFGGGTGLVGGQILSDGPLPLILSLERMTQIRAAYPQENVLIAEAGTVLADVQNAATEHNRLFPLSLASEGTARIGGCLSTNAGGLNVLRYGNARDLCLGLEVVLPDGTIWNGLKRLRKDNTGYDLKHLLMGAEGTLGVITAASLRLFPKPAHHGTAVLVVPDPAAALSLLSLARDQVGEVISGFELISRAGLEFLTETMPEVRQPFAAPPAWLVLLELGTSGVADPNAMLETLFAEALEQGLVQDGLIAQTEAQRAAFWTVRESIPEANKRIGSISSHDISLPLSQIPEFIATAPARLAALGEFRINCFGHLGDGNLHYNVFPPKGRTRTEFAMKRTAIKDVVHSLCHEMGGSVSAEHGIGRLKTGDLETYSDPAKLTMMRALKTALDPFGIMNPGAVLR